MIGLITRLYRRCLWRWRGRRMTEAHLLLSGWQVGLYERQDMFMQRVKIAFIQKTGARIYLKPNGKVERAYIVDNTLPPSRLELGDLADSDFWRLALCALLHFR